MRMTTSTGGQVPYPIESFRWWAALKLYGSAKDKEGLEEFIRAHGSAQETLFVQQASIDTFEFLREHFPDRTKRAVAQKEIWAEAIRLREAARLRDAARRSSVRSSGMDARSDMTGAAVGAGVGWFLGGVPGGILGGVLGVLFG
jgi:hypothetical protein